MDNKQKKIIEMFDDIAPSYDLANRVLSLGIDIKWRKEACKKSLELQPNKNLIIADIACGTGDMILHWQNFTRDKNVKFIGVDPSSGMLEIAKKKLQNTDQKNQVELFLAQAQDLSVIASNSVDILSIAYGIRNVVDINKAFQEFARVLKQNGVLVILEFTKKQKKNILDSLMGFYTKKILPFIGGIISKNYAAYQYLPDSIEDFLSTEVLASKLEKEGFNIHSVKSYSAGISTLIIAIKR
ncbi:MULTISPECIES: bifunctional demethylmenaquinone methyltransferase/2-methoxy-6-polyprenyl-1,4-benzoquinol methylase UbiE [unclassified Helicobacter]|uniref:bifunctional demethylmenaquinone methyltransferase/2-methoxy-6-polyprenyl-1,4-benzoquinol methylase UbiE n=1 Tax=unclassified Helicobacter TaxID=2593540 RepID=UPI000CF01B45|nr:MULTISPECIES: bifunctional demethylmenaquinone methyltransferase/2-methoxy-6-polyprenyl-1,4-benzoquinol methylase UbiE [unclassified Helicobacter]